MSKKKCNRKDSVLKLYTKTGIKRKDPKKRIVEEYKNFAKVTGALRGIDEIPPISRLANNNGTNRE